MTKLELARTVTKNIVSLSVGFAVSNAIKNSVPATKTHHKVQLVIGAGVVAYMVSEKAERWAVEKFDDAVNWYKTNVTKY